jgi:glycosyltransferase involved in cell wall biosynthesis
MTPRVSLGLPVYNGERYVRQALDSVLAQEYGDFELVICDNASTDTTPDICRDYAARDRRVVYHRNPSNIGAAPNFKRAFALSSGEYFKWVVYDDLLEPGYVGKCVALLDEAPDDVVLTYPRTVLIDEANRELRHWEDRLDIREERPHRRLAHLLWNVVYCHPSLGLIKSRYLRRTRVEDGFESADVVVLGELAMLGAFWEHPEYLYRRRIHDESSMRASPEVRAVWLDPTNADRPVLPRTKLFVEMSRSIARAPLTLRDKALCQAVVARIWGSRHWRDVGRECGGLLRHYARRALR